MLDIKDFHGQNAPKEELEKVEVLPYSDTLYVAGYLVALPEGEWNDYEYFEVTYAPASGSGLRMGDILSKDILQQNPESFTYRFYYNSGATQYTAGFTATSATQASIVRSDVAGHILTSLVGYKKRYATKNRSRTISVNLGNNIAVNSRYEVDLPSEFYEADGSIKKGVQVRAEIYVAGNSYTGWGESELDLYYVNGWYHSGLQAEITEDKVTVITAGFGANAAFDGAFLVADNKTNKWGTVGTGSIPSAQCRVIATLNDAYVLSVEPAQGAVQRCTNNDATALSFTSAGEFAYTPLSNADQDGELFEYNSTTRFMRVKKSGLYNLALTSHTEDGAGVAEITTVLVEADTAAGDNAAVFSPALTKVYSSTSDQSSQTVRGNFELDESKWYALYKQNESSGDVDFTTVTDAVVDPDVTGDAVKYAFLFTLKRP